jgi:tRNA G18 (ribose-2'-O)-methylase SpoU
LSGEAPIDPWDRRLIRASRGCVFRLPVVPATRSELLHWCSAHEVDLVVTSPHAGTSVRALAAHPRRLALVFGSERHGCSLQLTQAAAMSVRIPTSAVESLNVSAAAGIALYARCPSRQGQE